MNIHEYQAKETLKLYGVQIQEGIVATTVEEAKLIAIKERIVNKQSTSSDNIEINSQHFKKANRNMNFSKKRDYKLKPKDYYEMGSIGIE